MDFHGFVDYFRDYALREKIQFRYHFAAKILYYCVGAISIILLGYARGMIVITYLLLEIVLLLGNAYDHQLPLEDEVQQKRIMFHIFMKGVQYGGFILLGVGFDFLFQTRTAREMVAYPMAFALTLGLTVLYMLASMLDFAKSIYVGEEENIMKEGGGQISQRERRFKRLRVFQKNVFFICCLVLSLLIILFFYFIFLLKHSDMPVLQGILEQPGSYLFVLAVCVMDVIEIARSFIPWEFSDFRIDQSDRKKL